MRWSLYKSRSFQQTVSCGSKVGLSTDVDIPFPVGRFDPAIELGAFPSSSEKNGFFREDDTAVLALRLATIKFTYLFNRVW